MSQYERVPNANMKRDMTLRSPKLKSEIANDPSPFSHPDKDKNWV